MIIENAFPLAPPSDVESMDDYNKLKTLVTNGFIKESEWFSRSEFSDEYKRNLLVDSDRTGMAASNRHHWYARMACDSINCPSPIRSWYQSEIRATLENSKYFAESPKTALALRKYIASQFKPSAALAIYRYFDAQSVYDPCGGWGDRLVAAMAGGIRYHCRETNPLVIAANEAMQNQYDHSQQVSFEYKGSEIDAPDGEFDMAFTSPPYWKAEKYQGNKSSHAVYKKFDDWMSGFMFPMVDNALKAVKSGGIVAINVSDIYANHTYNKIVQPVISQYLHCSPYVIGYKMAKRVGSKSNQEGVFAEPIIILTKKSSQVAYD